MLWFTPSFEYFIYPQRSLPQSVSSLYFLSQTSPSLKLVSHHHKPHLLNRLLPPLTLSSSSSSLSAKSLIISSLVNVKSLIIFSNVNAVFLVLQVRSVLALIAWVEARCCKVMDVRL